MQVPNQLNAGRNSEQNHSSQLANLQLGRTRTRNPTFKEPKFKDVSTSMRCYHGNPSPVTLTQVNKVRDQMAGALDRIKSTRHIKKIRTVDEKIMTLQFIFDVVNSHNCTLTDDVSEAQRAFH